MGLPNKKRSIDRDSSDSNNNNDYDNDASNKSKKQKKSSNPKKTKKIMRGNPKSLLEKALQDGRNEAKKEFEQQRTTIYNTLSSSYKEMFQTIVFAKWKKTYLPALILSPYSVPPGPVRTMWMDKYEKLLAKNMLDQMIYLIYWYGSKNDQDYYGFVSRTNFTTYDQEVTKGPKGLHHTIIIPNKIQEKINKNTEKLNSNEEDIVRTYNEVQEDINKDPIDRKRGVLHFQEGYDMLTIHDLDGVDVNDSDDDSDDSDDDDDGDNDDDKSDSEDEEEHEEASKNEKVDDDNDDDHKSTNNKKKGLTKKTNKATKDVTIKKTKTASKKDTKDDVESVLSKAVTSLETTTTTNEKDSESQVTAKTVSKNNKKKRDLSIEDSLASVGQNKKIKRELENDDSAAVHSDEIGDDEDDDDDESDADVERDDDEDRAIEEEEEDDDDDDDHDFVENVIARKKPKQQQLKSAQMKKVKPAKKDQNVKIKMDKPKTDKQLKRKELEVFHHNEDVYVRLIRRWESAIQSENVDRLRRIMNEAYDVVHNFCYSFLLCYDLSTIIKNSKRVLKNANDDLIQFAALRDKIKTTFEAKRLLVPKGYVVPKMSSSATTSESAAKTKSSSDIDTSEHDTKIRETVKNDIKQEQITIREPSLTSSTSTSKLLIEGNSSSNKNTVNVTTPAASLSSSSLRTNTNTAPKFKSLLGNIMQQHQRPSSLSLQSQSKSDSNMKGSKLGDNVAHQVPLWASSKQNVSSLQQNAEKNMVYTNNDVRSLGYDFLVQMISNLPFPADLGIDIDSMTKAIETAIFDWSNKMVIEDKQSDEKDNDSTWMKLYWSKLHLIVTAFCGGSPNTTTSSSTTIFYQNFLQGKFDTPDKIVTSQDEQYIVSAFGKMK